MSYDITLTDPITHKVIETDIPIDLEGGTNPVQFINGSPVYQGHRELWLNMTSNYTECFARYDKVDDDSSFIRRLDGRVAADTIEELKAMCEALGDDVNGDYWKPTEGNAKRALFKVLAMAKMYPYGVWNIDY